MSLKKHRGSTSNTAKRLAILRRQKMASIESGLVVAGTKDHEHQVKRPEHADRCGHRLLSVVPVVSMRVECGYAARCLLCGMIGPARSNGEAARRVLLDQLVGSEE